MENLTNQEKEVMRLISKGYTNLEIAAELFISYGTVKNHCHNLMKKLGIKSRNRIIAFYYEKKIEEIKGEIKKLKGELQIER